MELDQKYTFVHLEQQKSILNDKTCQEFFSKWGLKDNLSIQHYSFNEKFHIYNKYHLVEDFFKNNIVATTLKTKKGRFWVNEGKIASKVDIKYVPCNVTKMSFFDKIKNPDNGIVRQSDTICKKNYDDIDGFLIANHLQAMLLDEECESYHLYESNEKEEFIFRIFQLLILGGTLCQYDDELKPYLNVTKKVYKDLVRVENQDNKLSISTIVFKVVAKSSDDTEYFPYNSENIQNVAFVCIDPRNQLITTFLHQYN